MPRFRIFRLMYLLLPLLILAGCKTEGKRPVVKIGYMLCNNEHETTQRFLPLTRYLSDTCGVDFVMVAVDAHDFEKPRSFERWNPLCGRVLMSRTVCCRPLCNRQGNKPPARGP